MTSFCYANWKIRGRQTMASKVACRISAALMFLIVFVAFVAVPEHATAADRQERTVRVGAQERSYTVYLPDGVAEKSNLRVIIAFHPALAGSDFMAEATRLHSLPAARDLIVVYPEGIMRTWNAGFCCGPAKKRGVDDVAFFKAMMADLATIASIRPKAYLTGFSNGALMAFHLMCEAGDQVAAAAPFAGYLPPDEMRGCRGGPIPLLYIHGDADTTSVVGGGATRNLGFLPPARDAIDAVAEMNGADLSQPTTVDVPALGTSCLRFDAGSAASETSLCVIPGLGHTWPGMAERGANSQFGPARPDLAGSEAIMQFFMQH